MAIEVIVFTMEGRVVVDVDDDVEVARRAAGGAVLPLAIEAKPLAGRDPRGNLRGDLALAPDASRAAARLAGFADDLAAPAARRTRARHREEALLVAQLTRALALGAHFRRAARGRAGAPAGLAGFLARNLDGGFGPGKGLFERNLEVVAQVGSALRPAAAAASAE